MIKNFLVGKNICMDKLYLSNLEDGEVVFPERKTFEEITNYGQEDLQRES